jgi:menaquinone-9 beta-reductase
MAAARPITIIGGGLAGLALGIGLRQRGVPVTIEELGHFPRHRVCGEFISGRGQGTLDRLGLREVLADAGAVGARTAAFFSASRSTAPRPLPSSALCLSRFAMDAALAAQFRKLGGALLEGNRSAGTCGEGVVRATGRRLRTKEDDDEWFGLKIHARNVALVADLEMHTSARGYVGLCRVGDDRVNICGLFRKKAGRVGEAELGRERLRGRPGSTWHERLARAEFDDASFCAVAGLSLRPQRAAMHPEICVGDAVTMIPPVTGNGMSMAFESAELAWPSLVAWSCGEVSWGEAHQTIARATDAAFASRLAWARWLQRIMLTPALQNPFIVLAARSDWLWRQAFERTR